MDNKTKTKAKSMKAKGHSNKEIAEKLGCNESEVIIATSKYNLGKIISDVKHRCGAHRIQYQNGQRMLSMEKDVIECNKCVQWNKSPYWENKKEIEVENNG